MATHDIVVNDAGGNKPNKYKLVFSGDHKPTKTTHRGATVNSSDSVFKNNQGDWVAQGVVYGGKDGWTYSGEKLRMAFVEPGRIEIGINDNDWLPADDFNATDKFATDPDSDKSSGGGGGNSSPTDKGGSSDKEASWVGRDGPIENLRERYGVVNRPRLTSDHETVYVGHGEFKTGDGSRGEPFGTVQDALNNMPEGIRHEYVMQSLPGTHDGEPGNSLNSDYHNLSGLSSSKIRLLGDRDNPQNHVHDANQMNFEFYSSALESQLEGIHFKGTVQTYEGSFSIEDSIMEPNGRWGRGNNYLLDTYGGKVIINRTEMRGNGADAVFNLTEGTGIYLGANVSIESDAPLCAAGIGGGQLSINPSAEIDVPCLSSGWEPAGIQVVDTDGVTDGIETGKHVIRHGEDGLF